MQSKLQFHRTCVTLAVIVVCICAIIACTLDTSKPPSLLPSVTPRPTRLPSTQPTPTALPPVNPTPIGGPISVASPLPTPLLSTLAISPSNVDRITETLRLGEPEPSNLSFGSGLYARWTMVGLGLGQAFDLANAHGRTLSLIADSLWPVDAHRAQPGRPMGGRGKL